MITSGKKIAITSSSENFEKAKKTAEAFGLNAVHFATIEIVPLEFNMPGNDHDWVVFTSRNAVANFFPKAGLKFFSGKKTGSIGGETSAELEKYGIKPDFTPAEFNSAAFVKEIGLLHEFRGKKVLMPCSDISGKNIVAGLKELGAETDRVFVYKTVKAEKTRAEIVEFLDNRPYCAVLFSSPSSFRNFLEITGLKGRVLLDESVPVAIGNETAEAIKKAGMKSMVTSEKSTFESMVEAAAKTDSKG